MSIGFIIPDPLWDPVTPNIDPEEWYDDDE
jgi:hypothetical protein